MLFTGVNALILEKWGVKTHNCALLLDFLALFWLYRMYALISRISRYCTMMTACYLHICNASNHNYFNCTFSEHYSEKPSWFSIPRFLILERDVASDNFSYSKAQSRGMGSCYRSFTLVELSAHDSLNLFNWISSNSSF